MYVCMYICRYICNICMYLYVYVCMYICMLSSTQHKETSLHDACREGQLAIIESLHSANCDLNIANTVSYENCTVVSDIVLIY